VRRLSRYTIFVITRDHEKFILDNLSSIVREIGKDIPILLIDTGSIDRTLDLALKYLTVENMVFESHSLPRGSTSLEALQYAQLFCDSDYMIGISGDDVFGSGYMDGLKEFESLDTNSRSLGFFEKIVCDENLEVLSRHKSNWAPTRTLNRRLLETSNPGNSAGIILPWKYIKENGFLKDTPPILIEDYWLCLTLVDNCDFLNLSQGSALYRRHRNALGFQNKSKIYAYSLGYCSGMAFNPSSWFGSVFRNAYLVLRLIRHLSVQCHPSFLYGWWHGLKKFSGYPSE
jgi:glycosyltransferase involved in cell wall biosynthesis